MRPSEVARIASEYFSLLARAFPIMCASDEFHFVPRVQEAGKYLERVDRLSREAIFAAVESVQDLHRQLQAQAVAEDLEEEIDRQLLLHNMAGLLIELENVKSWRYNPVLYLKLGCIGVDHALNKPCSTEEERLARTAERLLGLVRLIDEARENVTAIPGPYYRAAQAMVRDAQDYLSEVVRDPDSQRTTLGLACKEAQQALSGFQVRLAEIGPTPAAAVRTISVEELVHRHFGCMRTVEEIYEIAEEEWYTTLEEIERLRRHINPHCNWQQIYESYLSNNAREFDLFQLYANEIEALRKLSRELELLEDHLDQPVVLAETPRYMHSVRSGASYCTPLSIHPAERAFFYITTGGPSGNTKMDMRRRQRLQREFRFLSAHETYPGHHLLDSYRRHLDNQVRRQVESPLFYEGWAYYAESILAESGYVTDEPELLVDYKRRLWRAGRCLIDTGLALKRFTTEKAADLLVSVGFAAEEAVDQIERFRLNPGYQLCYSLGKYEIVHLRQRFLAAFGWKRFHRLLLEGGEIPFHLAARRFENLSENLG
jgi:hypothetical protein